MVIFLKNSDKTIPFVCVNYIIPRIFVPEQNGFEVFVFVAFCYLGCFVLKSDKGNSYRVLAERYFRLPQNKSEVMQNEQIPRSEQKFSAIVAGKRIKKLPKILN